MKRTLTLEIPTSWKDVTLKQYLLLQADLEAYRDDEEAQTALMLHHLCGLQPEYLKGLSADSYQLVKAKLHSFVSPEGSDLERFVTIDGVEYGFEPNLSKMAYGAYADITANDTISIDKNWAKIMSILYRPVVSKRGSTYTIQPYTGELDEKKWLGVPMNIHWGVFFFFLHLHLHLLNAIPNYLKELKELPASIKSTLRKNGELMQRLLSSPMDSLTRLMK